MPGGRKKHQPDNRPPVPDLKLPRMSKQRLQEWRGGWFIADEHLENFDEYYDHAIGDIVVIMGNLADLFFELAGRAVENGQDCHGYWVVPINPRDEFRDLPVVEHYPHGHPSHPMEDSVEVAIQEPDPPPQETRPWRLPHPNVIVPEGSSWRKVDGVWVSNDEEEDGS